MNERQGQGAAFPSLRVVVESYRPDHACGYRLLDGNGNRYPGADQPALVCLGRVDLPCVAAGKYRILFFDRQDREIAPTGDVREPEVDIDRDLRVHVSPAAFDEAETSRSLRIERRQLDNRGRRSLVDTVDGLAQSFAKLQATVIDREQSQADALRTIVELQKETAAFQVKLMHDHEERIRGAAETEAKLRTAVEESIQRFQGRSDWAAVVKEGIKEVSSVAQLIAVQAAASRSIADGKPRSAETESTNRLPPKSPAALPPVLPQSPAKASTAGDADADWLLTFFGLSDSPPRSGPTIAEASKADTTKADTAKADTAKADAPKVDPKDPDPPAPPASDARPDAPTRGSTPDGAQHTARTADSIAAADAALQALETMQAVIDQAAAALPPARLPRRVEPWSVAWAWREIKRRVMSLSETRIALLTSSRYHVLEFLRELGAIARPPARALAGAT